METIKEISQIHLKACQLHSEAINKKVSMSITAALSALADTAYAVYCLVSEKREELQ